MRVRLFVLGLVVCLLTACQSAPSATPARDPGSLSTASSPSPTPTAADARACRLLTSAERKSIAGEELDIVAPSSGAPRGSSQCRWVKSLQAPTPTLIQVVAMSAQQWARNVPQQVDRIITAGQAKKLRQRLLAAKKKVRKGLDTVTDRDACDMFSLLWEVHGREKGTFEVVSFPSYGSQLSVNASGCKHGRYISFTYTEGGLQPSSPLSIAALRLLHAAEARAEALAD